MHVVAEASEAVAALEVKLGVLTSELNDVVDRVSRIQHAPDDSGLAELAARLEALERSPAPSGGTPTFEGLDAEGMEQLTAQIAEATAAWEHDRAALEARVTELAQRVARAPCGGGRFGRASADGRRPTSTISTASGSRSSGCRSSSPNITARSGC